MFWRFSIIASSLPSHSLATDYWPLFPCHGPLSSRFTPHAPRPTPHAPRPTPHAPRPTPHAPRPTPPSAGTSGVRSCANPPPLASLSPTVGLPKTERDPISTGTPYLKLCHRTRRFLRTNQTILPLPARRRPPLTILSWQEAPNARGSKGACRMAHTAQCLFSACSP